MQSRHSLAALALAGSLAALAGTARAQQQSPPDSTEINLRTGVYQDTDRTQVIRSLIGISTPLNKRLTLSGTFGIDIVSSASVDVRSSPKVDALTSASSPGKPRLKDQRKAYDLGLTWSNGTGTLLSLNLDVANENDYLTIGGTARAAIDFNQRNTTLLLGFAFGHDWISSVIDRNFHAQLTSTGYSLGIAQVLGQSTALRVRYDGGYLTGYEASPYRAIRYGAWTATSNGSVFTFRDVQSTGPERMPLTRLRHAGVVELVQSLGQDLALAPVLSVGYDDWGLLSESAGIELRIARPAGWRFTAGYRFYNQGGVGFYRPRYTGPASAYDYATSDKKLGPLYGHGGNAGISWQILERGPTRRVGLSIDLRGDVMYYRYLDFPLLDSKTAFYIEAGLKLNF